MGKRLSLGQRLWRLVETKQGLSFVSDDMQSLGRCARARFLPRELSERVRHRGYFSVDWQRTD